jgi:hypothetical protein
MNAYLTTIVWIGFLLRGACLAQVAPTPSHNWKRATLLYPGTVLPWQEMTHNTPQDIRQELFDTNTLYLIGKYGGLPDEDIGTIQVAQDPGDNRVRLYQIGNSDLGFKVMSEQLLRYIRAREEGHTRALLLAAITNSAQTFTILDPDLRALASSRVLVPLSWLKKEASGISTNKVGTVVSRSTSITVVNGKTVTNEAAHVPSVDEVCRWTSYTLIDGDIGWCYFVMFKADGSVDYVRDCKCDAKEYDQRYEKTIREVDAEVEAEMKKNGSYGQLGSIHQFWRLKKEKLQASGIEWRSPSELNPNANFD